MKIFKLFSKFSGLKPNILKCEVPRIGSLKGVKKWQSVVLSVFIDLATKTIKILYIYQVYIFLIIKSYKYKKKLWKASLICKTF